LREGVRAERIIVTGNTVIDALLQSRREDYRFSVPALAALDTARRVVLVTLHRRESFGAPMRAVCAALRQIADRHPELTFVLPMHRNPSVRDVVLPALGGSSNFVLIEPLDYLDFIHLMARSFLIVTDSGGVQEEAPALDIPVLVTRDVTERPEGVEVGAARLVGTDENRIIRTLEELLTDTRAYEKMATAPNPYGDGRASERIVAALLKWADTAAAA
jgi:UDP-N-acetylglucosamine 2-epimerase